MIGMVDLSGKKGSKINGIIEEYVAKGNVSAGGFVKNTNECRVKNTKNFELKTNINKTNISAVELAKNKIFIMYTYNKYIYGMLCEVSNEQVITHTTKLCEAEEVTSVIKLDNGKLFIAYLTYSDKYYLHSMICTITDTTTTIETNIELNTSSYTAKNLYAILLDKNKVFIAYTCGTSTTRRHIYGIVCTINESTISVGTATQLSGEEASGKVFSVTKLADNKGLIAFKCYKSEQYLIYGIVCTINGSTISVGMATQLAIGNIDTTINNVSATTLTENEAFIAYQDKEGDISIIIINANEQQITVNKSKSFITIINPVPFPVYAKALNKHTIVIVYFRSTNFYQVTCAINEEKIIRRN